MTDLTRYDISTGCQHCHDADYATVEEAEDGEFYAYTRVLEKADELLEFLRDIDELHADSSLNNVQFAVAVERRLKRAHSLRTYIEGEGK